MHNILLRGAQSWTAVEAKLLALAVGHIHKDSEKLPAVKIGFHEVYKSDSQKNYKALDEACAGLKEKYVYMEDITSKRHTKRYYSIFRWIQLEAESKTITAQFEEDIAPYLLNLTEFTSVEIEAVLLFRNAHAARLFWLLKSYYHNIYEPTPEQLRKQLLGEKEWDQVYPLHNDFNRYVVKKALDEIKELTGWEIDKTEIKVGRKVQKFRFTMHPHAQPAEVAVIDTGVGEQPALATSDGDDLEAYHKSLSERPDRRYVLAWKYFTKDCGITPAATKDILDQVDALNNIEGMLAVIKAVRESLDKGVDEKGKKIKHRDRYAWSIISKHYKKLPSKLPE